MLALSRKNNEEVIVRCGGREIRIVLKYRAGGRKEPVLCFEAPADVQILRAELVGTSLDEQHRRNQEEKDYVRL